MTWNRNWPIKYIFPPLVRTRVVFFRFKQKEPSMLHGIVMFSGGLDSVCATHLLMSQGLSVKAVYFSLPFYTGFGLEYRQVRKAAEKLGVPLEIVEEGEEFLGVVKSPEFGFGKNANPCVDCRIHRLGKAKKIMEAEGAAFIATGEVVGQRPMSQRMDCLHKIENHAGLKGLLLRPLSAKLLPPTLAETSGMVDREKLLNISGRGRKEQLAYARKYALIHGAPAGGCILTNVKTAERFMDLSRHAPDFTLEDFRLLAWGRHFRLSPSCKLVVGRDDGENHVLQKIASAEDRVLRLPGDIPGPLGIVRGSDADSLVPAAASLFGRYTRFKDDVRCVVDVVWGEKKESVEVKPATDEQCASCRL
jgi:tRNA-specific 2-thiouridylase